MCLWRRVIALCNGWNALNGNYWFDRICYGWTVQPCKDAFGIDIEPADGLAPAMTPEFKACQEQVLSNCSKVLMVPELKRCWNLFILQSMKFTVPGDVSAMVRGGIKNPCFTSREFVEVEEGFPGVAHVFDAAAPVKGRSSKTFWQQVQSSGPIQSEIANLRHDVEVLIMASAGLRDMGWDGIQ
ncbi:serine transhydroxymethyltransferase 1 [Actinidia rufa]|uniref:Serine transhydroxymethyltransferase 1 n=1 Tax=Actinidia rufa TaxID=165716 RepID=A0A7J0H736_9ERIC|nr:serine transhydroxymethyltransferase 1 [Actinidia rufa]